MSPGEDVLPAEALWQTPAPLALLRGPKHVFEFANHAYRRLVGDRVLIGTPAREVLPELADQGFFELLDEVLASGAPNIRRGVRMLPSRDGSTGGLSEERFVDFTLQPLVESDDSRTGIFVLGVDVTERVRAEATLRDSEQRSRELTERLRLALNSAGVGIWDWDPVSGYAVTDSRTKALHGAAPDERATYHQFRKFLHPDDRERADRAVRAALDPASNGEFSLDYRIILPDGTVRWIHSRGRPIFAGDGEDRRAVRLLGTALDVTERRRAEEALRESHALLEAVIEGTTDAVYVKDSRGRYLLVNSATAQALGRTAQEVIGQDDFALFPRDLAERFSIQDRAVMTQGRAHTIEETFHLNDGGTRTYLSTRVPYRDAQGRVIGIIGIAKDITDRSRAEAALRESESKLRRIAESGIVGIFYWTQAGAITECNDAFLQMLGRTRDELRAGALDWRALTPREWEATDRGREAELVTTGSVGPWEKELFAKDGRRVPVLVAAAVLEGQTDRVAVCVDIRAHKAAEERIRLLSEMMPQQVWTATRDGHIDYLNQRAYEYTGMPRDGQEELISNRYLHPDDRERVLARWGHSVATGEPYELEYRLRRWDGQWRWFLARALPLRDESGQIVRWFGTCTDIHDQKMAEEARDRALAEAKRERERLREVFMQAPAAIAVMEGPEHVFTVANPMYCERVGRRELLGRSVRDAFPELQGQGFFELLDNVYSTGQLFVGREMPVRLHVGDGRLEERYFNFVYQPLTGVDRAVYGIMVHAVDITDQVCARREVERKAEELSRLTEALERSNRELDQFAYVASHDLKAPLRGIANLAQWIQEDVGAWLPYGSKEHLRLLEGRVHRMEALIEGILEYSRAARSRAKPEPTDVGRLVRDVVELLLPQGVTVDIAPDLPTVTTERVPLQQVVMNLISNAVKYQRAEAPRVEVGWRDVGEAYEFHVRDNGPGIAPEFHERIWGLFQKLEPRDEVEGAGIGLAVVRKIVESRGGRAWVESSLGAGATFYFTWPKTPAGGA